MDERDITNDDLKKVNLRPQDINVFRIPDPEIQNRKRIFLLIDKLSDNQLLQSGFKYLLKLPSLTIKELAFIDSAELYFNDDMLQKVKRSKLEALYKL